MIEDKRVADEIKKLKETEMKVSSSGELRILGIFSEINENDYSALNQDGTNNISLTGLSTGTFGTINTVNAS